MNSILTRVFVLPFYRRHTGLLVLGLLVCFCAVQAHALPAYHRAIMRSILSSPAQLLVVMLFWIAWYGRALRSGLRLLRSEEGRFLHGLRALPPALQWFRFLIVVIQWFAPVLIYSTALTIFALRHQQGACAITITTFQVVAFTFAVLYLLRAINKASVPAPFGVNTGNAHTKTSPFPLWPLRHLWKESPRAYIGIKLFSIALLYIPLVWNSDRYDHDSIVLFLVALVAANSWSALQCVRFLEGRLHFYRNLPVSTVAIASTYLLTYTVFLLPEAAYLLWAGSRLVAPLQLAGIWMVPLSSMLFLTAVQYGNGTGRDEYLKVLGGVSFVSLFFLNGEYYWRWALLLLAIATCLFLTGFRRFDDERSE